MRRMTPLLCAATLILTSCGSPAPVATVTRAASAEPRVTDPSSPAPTKSVIKPTGPATAQLSVSPFSSDGTWAPGFTLSSTQGDAVTCSDDKGSIHGISEDTHACGPQALRATACWRSPIAADNNMAIYCLPNPWETKVVRHLATQVPDSTPKPASAVPLGVELTDGSRWGYFGGAGWSTFPKDYEPRYECVAKCSKSRALGGLKGKPTLDQSAPTWTTFLLDADRGTSTPVAVAKAWFTTSDIRQRAYQASPTPGAASASPKKKARA